MKLKDALEIAKDCGLETIGEAILNIRLHAGSLFSYGEEVAEYKELCDEYQAYGLSLDTKIADL